LEKNAVERIGAAESDQVSQQLPKASLPGQGSVFGFFLDNIIVAGLIATAFCPGECYG